MHHLRSLIIVPAVFFIGCEPSPAAPDATPCNFDVELGPTRIAEFKAFSDGDSAELTLGFQGFRYVTSTVRMAPPEVSSQSGQVFFQIDVEGQEAYSLGEVVQLSEPESDGARYADNVLVFFNDTPVAELIGREVRVTTRVVVDTCVGIHAVNVVLADDDNCVEQEDGTFICDDGQ